MHLSKSTRTLLAYFLVMACTHAFGTLLSVAHAQTVNVDADFIWDDNDAAKKCPALCEAKNLYWAGTWSKEGWTDSPVCQCGDQPRPTASAPAPEQAPSMIPPVRPQPPVMPNYGPYTILDHSDLPRNDLGNRPARDWADCANLCSNSSGCGAFTYAVERGVCFLKSQGTNPKYSRSAISGVRAYIQDNPPPPPLQGSYCSINSTLKCPGCSVSCPQGKQAVCTHAVEGVTSFCARNSSCTCN